MPARQPEFSFMPPKPRTPRVKRAHVIDAGDGQGDHPYGAQFKCKVCQWESSWWCFNNITEIRRGVPCPNCNPVQTDDNLPILNLPMIGTYYDQIKSGAKDEEYRQDTPYWRRRLEGREYGKIILTRGYPKREDASRRIERSWRGIRNITLTHEHFGPDPVSVIAIKVN